MYRAKNDNLRNQNSTDREFQVFREFQVDTMAYFELFCTYTINFGSNNDKELPSEGWTVIKCIHECNQSGPRLVFYPEPICQKFFVG